MKKILERYLYSFTYTFMFSAYPVLGLLTNNIYQVNFTYSLRSLVVFIVFSGILFLLFFAFNRDLHLSAFQAFIVFFMFTIYGHFVNFVQIESLLFPVIWIIISLLILVLIQRNRNRLNLVSLAPVFNLVVIILLLFQLAKIVKYEWRSRQPFRFTNGTFTQLSSKENVYPDIYYIILDGYARSDYYLQFGYDNSGFIQDLESMGFYVAKCSQSNYNLTALSFTSSLNMDYIQNLSDKFVPEERELLYLFQAFQENAVRQSLQEAGYSIVSFSSGFPLLEMKDVDTFYQPLSIGINEFEILVLKSTYGRVLDDWNIINFDRLAGERYRGRTLLVLGSFDEFIHLESPKFVFIHLLASHSPFVFDRDGNRLDMQDMYTDNGYMESSAFISDQLVSRLRALINESGTSPIILLQSDHGPVGPGDDWGHEQRLGILNAYYLPGHSELLYPTISPVNTFRIVFNEYFYTEYPLLDDISYFTHLPNMYKFSVVPNNCTNP